MDGAARAVSSGSVALGMAWFIRSGITAKTKLIVVTLGGQNLSVATLLVKLA